MRKLARLLCTLKQFPPINLTARNPLSQLLFGRVARGEEMRVLIAKEFQLYLISGDYLQKYL
jgi:hypothetical protein